MWSSRINSVPLPIMPSKRIENNASRIVVLGAIASEEFMLTAPNRFSIASGTLESSKGFSPRSRSF